MSSTFSATVGAWARRVEAAHLAIFREASSRVIEEMLRPRGSGGNMPVDTGFLRASLVASTSQMPTLREGAKPTEGATYAQDGQVNLVIATAQLGETLFSGFVAQYSAAMNYGFGSHQGYLFVELAAQQWQAIVSQVETELVTRAGLS